MKKRKLIVNVGSVEAAAKEFIDIWHRVETNQTPKNIPIEKISFHDAGQLFKTLSPKRCDLLRYIHEHGKISIRAVAKGLHRDYSNVYNDIKILHRIGLILQDKKDDKYLVPWDVIITEIPMVTIKHQATKQASHYKKYANK